MGVYKRGINGAFSGKTGSVIGSKWRNVDYMKGRAKPSQKPASEAQILQRKKMGMMSAFLRPMAHLFEWSYSGLDTRFKTAYNIVLGYHLKWAFTYEGGDCSIDYSKVVLSRGSLPQTPDAVAETLSGGGLLIRWPAVIRNSFVSPEDAVNLILYNSSSRQLLISCGTYFREDGEARFFREEGMESGVWHVYLFYTSPQGENSSSQYLRAVAEPMDELTVSPGI